LVINDLCKLVRNLYYPIIMTIIEDELILTREACEVVPHFGTSCVLACCRSAHPSGDGGVRLWMLLPCSIAFGSLPSALPKSPFIMYAYLD
jgi:hypothetical protein